jgi:branched-subunit amino acid aminotransferase/4-amino-4-deoxychorismate lyase
VTTPTSPAGGPARPHGLTAWVNGRLLPAQQATVSAYDRGFRSGEGVFETLRAYGDHVFRLDAHLGRAIAGAAELGFSPGPRGELARAVRRTAEANLPALQGADSALRLTVSAGAIDPGSPFPGAPTGDPTVVVTSHPLVLDPAPQRHGSRAVAVPLARELPHVKAVSYLVAVTAKRRARAEGADEALLTDVDGNVLEGASTNVFAVIGGRLVTPPTDAGLLAGVTRSVVLEVAARVGIPADERPLSLAELVAADEAFLTATTREVIPLVAVGAEPVGSGRPGPVTATVLDGYRAEVDRERRLSTRDG